MGALLYCAVARFKLSACMIHFNVIFVMYKFSQKLETLLARRCECAQIYTSFDIPFDINPDKTLTYRSDV